MRHEFHPEAFTEYEEAARYYAERDARVAEQFVAAVADTIEPDYVLIVAVMHCSREPGYWRTRL